jgi:hypothetical protein
MSVHDGWRTGQVFAWAEHDGPGRPPVGGNGALTRGLAWALGGVTVGMFSTDVLCPEHRAWVQLFATAAVAAVAAAAVGLVRRWALAPFLAVVAGTAGIGIGLVDMAHAPLRGQAITAAFGVVVVAASVLALRAARLARWGWKAAQVARPATCPAADLEPVDTAVGATTIATGDSEISVVPAATAERLR